jgi:hypothetical protein
MDKALKKKWVKALRSGRYPQTSGALCIPKGEATDFGRPAGYCCLGVLGKVARTKSADNGYLQDAESKSLLLPYPIQRQLAKLNDDGVPFEIIAGLIDTAL